MPNYNVSQSTQVGKKKVTLNCDLETSKVALVKTDLFNEVSGSRPANRSVV